MTIDDVKAFWDKSPCNIRHSNKEVGTPEYFIEVSLRKYFVENHINDFAEFDTWGGGKRVLEVGCGIGTAMQSFSQHGAIYTGIDLSKNSINICVKRVEVFKLKNVQIHMANVESLSEFIEPAPFDLIYSFGVLHHTPDANVALKELQKFTKPGTRIKIMLYSRFSTKSLSLWLKYGWRVGFSLDKAVALQSEAQFGCPITRTFSKNTACKMLSKSGVRITKVYKQHIFPYSIKHYVGYEYKRRFYWRMIPNSTFQRLERILGWHLLIEGIYD